MYQSLSQVTLKSGEKVDAGFVLAPDGDWRGRIEGLLGHKPPVWQWQISALLAGQEGMETRFHVLHRGGVPFSHILTVERDGVGILGHVWTEPEDRGKAAASQLMGSLLEYFRTRGGEALFLDTGFESPAYRIYQKCGFASVEPGSGVMAYFATSQQQFEEQHFFSSGASVRALGWAHYPTASALFTAGFPGTIRNASYGLWGRALTEAPLMRALQQERTVPEADNPQAVVLETDAGAVAGLATWKQDALWPQTRVVDLYCHPDFWHRGGELLARLSVPDSRRVVAYADVEDHAKQQVMETAGYRLVAKLPQWVARDAVRSGYLDVLVYERH